MNIPESKKVARSNYEPELELEFNDNIGPSSSLRGIEKGRAFLEQYWILNRNNIAIALVGNGKGGGGGRTQRPNSAPLFGGYRKERS